MTKVLEGIRVIDLSHVVAGPLASFFLAQLGAEVIKIEKPVGGDVMRAGGNSREGDTPAGFAALNAGKRSMAVDIRNPEGAALVRELARKADVFIENFRPGVVAKYGLDHLSIKAVSPDIVYCSISGYGQKGIFSQRGAYDHVIQALTGMMMMSGDQEDGPPVKVGFPVIDVAAGVLGALSVVGALFGRSRGMPGQHIDASMVQASLMLMYTNATAYATSGVTPKRVGNRGYSGSPSADTYQCSDGWLSIAANTPVQFRKVCKILGLEALCEDARALDLAAFNSPEGGFVVAKDLEYVRAQLRDNFVGRRSIEMEKELNDVGVPAARVRRLGEFLEEARSGCVSLPDVRFDQDGRTVRTTGLGFEYASASKSDTGAEALGSSTRKLMQQLGISSARIDELALSGIVGVQPE